MTAVGKPSRSQEEWGRRGTSTATSWWGRCRSSPPAIEEGIEEYLTMQAALETGRDEPPRPALDDGLIAPPPAAPPVTVSDALLHRSP